ncbi:MAG: DUF3293 domain-containing protein, partial [Spirochaetota bacterium]
NLKSIAILTAYRSENPREHNSKNLRELEGKLKGWGCRVKRIVGHGQEEGGRTVKEPSFVVYNITFDQAKQLWQQYDQWGIIYIGEETRNKPLILGSEPHPAGHYEDVVGELGAPKVVTPGTPKPQNWSEIPNKKKPGYGFELPFVGPTTLPGHVSPRLPKQGAVDMPPPTPNQVTPPAEVRQNTQPPVWVSHPDTPTAKGFVAEMEANSMGNIGLQRESLVLQGKTDFSRKIIEELNSKGLRFDQDQVLNYLTNHMQVNKWHKDVDTGTVYGHVTLDKRYYDGLVKVLSK